CLSFHKSPLLKRSQRGTHLERTPLFFCLMSSSAYGGPGRIHVITRHCVCVFVCVRVWVCVCVCVCVCGEKVRSVCNWQRAETENERVGSGKSDTLVNVHLC